MNKKFFRVAKAGDTVDGRYISAEQIKQIVETYDPATYGARVWIEHMRSLLPDAPFKAYGDVEAVKLETTQEGDVYLLAAISPTLELKTINKMRQKIYTSVEIAEDFAKTGKAYLMGLAVTDSPASLGTEALFFNTQNNNRFVTNAIESVDFYQTISKEELNMEELKAMLQQTQAEVNQISQLLSQKQEQQEQEQEQQEPAIAQTEFDATQIVKDLQELNASVNKDLEELKTQFSEISAMLNKTDEEPRQLAAGESSEFKTDC